MGGLWVWKVRGKIIRVDWAEFRIIWSRETSETPQNRKIDVVIVFDGVGGDWRSGKYAGKSYESDGLNFKLCGHGKRPQTDQHSFRDFVHF